MFVPLYIKIVYLCLLKRRLTPENAVKEINVFLDSNFSPPISQLQTIAMREAAWFLNTYGK